MAKQRFQGQDGVWRTLPNGVHIFIPDGQTAEDVINNFADEDWEKNYTKSQYADEILKSITYADFKYWYEDKDTHERVKPAKHAKNVIRNVIEWHDTVDPAMDDFILKGLKNNVSELIINDRKSNWFKRDYWSGKTRIQIDIDGNSKSKILEAISHEIGHAIDCRSDMKYMSSTFVSEKHGKTLQDMFKSEVPDIELLTDEIELLSDLKRQVNSLKDHMSKEEYAKAYFRYDESQTCLCDMFQAIYGDKECESRFGFLPHERKYFENNNENTGTELFAELTSDLFWDNEKRFYNTIKQHCPKTIEIYHEIMEEVKKSWTS